MFNFDLENTRHNSSETTLSRANVMMLKESWAFAGSGGITSTPLVTGDVVYFTDHGRTSITRDISIPDDFASVYALDAKTGEMIWATKQMPVRGGTPLVTADSVYTAGYNTVYAWKRSDGTAVWSTLIDMGTTDPLIESSPQLAKDKIVIGLASYEVTSSKDDYSARGAVIALDAKDGHEVWRVWTAQNDETSGAGVSVWSSAAVDLRRNLLFIGTGQAYEPPAGPYADAVLAIEIDSGAVTWHHQFHPDDVYTDGACLGGAQNCRDWDIGAAPNLFTARGKDVVGVGSKGGVYKTLDRDTGVPVWERQLTAGSALGGVMSVAAVGDGIVYVSSTAGRGATTFALNADSGEIEWQKAMSAVTWGALTLANGLLFQPTRNGMLYAMDASDGSTLWQQDLMFDAAGGVTVAHAMVYAPSGFTGLGMATRAGARLTAFGLDGTSAQMGGGAGAAAGGPVAGSGSTPAASGCLEACALLERRCSGAMCHATAGPVAMLDLQAPGIADRVRGVVAKTAACAGEVLLDPAAPERSLLYTKLTDPPKCGLAMPPDAALAADEIACLRSWVANPVCSGQ